MTRYLSVLAPALCLLTGCALFTSQGQPDFKPTPLAYEIDLTSRADDLFKVTLQVNDLSAENNIYQFASTAPGTYQVMDIGRYVREFTAYDDAGNELPASQVSTNQWQLTQPESISRIVYSVAETWDTEVESNPVMKMAGTSIEDDHVQFLAHCVLGYPAGMQSRAVRVKFLHPQEWTVGTALTRDVQGYYAADDYDHAVDSPILMGRLSIARLEVMDSAVEVFTYSKTDKVKSEDILDGIREILLAAARFMNGLPVDRYTFLFHFEDVSRGAWEHSYSSNYVYSEEHFVHSKGQAVPPVVAHEFFHVLTPLNLHSEIIEQFNFVQPVPSQHLWLYEATTEWAAQTMQLRAGTIDLETYLQRMTGKLKTAGHFRDDYSLRDLALQAFTEAGQRQYANIYLKGAVTIGLLDIQLLELSGGQRGLREVVNELAKRYGPEKAFSEEEFIDEFIALTYPQVGSFFDKYILQAEPLPVAEFYGKIGVDYRPEVHTGEEETISGFTMIAPQGKLAVSKVKEEVQKFGLRDGDVIIALNGESVDLKNVRAVFGTHRELEAGVPYELTVDRDGKTITLTCERIKIEKVDRHVLEVNPDATTAQLKLREVWLRNI